MLRHTVVSLFILSIGSSLRKSLCPGWERLSAYCAENFFSSSRRAYYKPQTYCTEFYQDLTSSRFATIYLKIFSTSSDPICSTGCGGLIHADHWYKFCQMTFCWDGWDTMTIWSSWKKSHTIWAPGSSSSEWPPSKRWAFSGLKMRTPFINLEMGAETECTRSRLLPASALMNILFVDTMSDLSSV